MLFWKPKPMTDEMRSIKALKTFRVKDGRVSVHPCEVLDQPGYWKSGLASAAWCVRDSSKSISWVLAGKQWIE